LGARSNSASIIDTPMLRSGKPELLIAEALHPYPKGLVIATKGGNPTSPGQWVQTSAEYLAQAVDKSSAIETRADRPVAMHRSIQSAVEES